MVSEATGKYQAMSGTYYLYVADADAAMAQALKHGAELETTVTDMPYGDRQGGVRGCTRQYLVDINARWSSRTHREHLEVCRICAYPSELAAP